MTKHISKILLLNTILLLSNHTYAGTVNEASKSQIVKKNTSNSVNQFVQFDSEEFFDEFDDYSDDVKSSWFGTSTYKGPVNFKTQSITKNIIIKQGPVKAYQSSFSGSINVDKGNASFSQSSIQNLIVSDGNVKLEDVSINGKLSVVSGNVSISSSSIREVDVNDQLKIVSGSITRVKVASKAQFENTSIKKVIIPSHSKEKAISIINSDINEIEFVGSNDGTVYLKNLPKYRTPVVKGGRIIIQK